MATPQPQTLIERARAEKSKLRRVMGLRDLILFYTIAVVGLRWVPTAASLGPSAITLWLLSFVFFFLPLAFTVAELSSRYPEEGGIYVWVKQTFGDFHAFLQGTHSPRSGSLPRPGEDREVRYAWRYPTWRID